MVLCPQSRRQPEWANGTCCVFRPSRSQDGPDLSLTLSCPLPASHMSSAERRSLAASSLPWSLHSLRGEQQGSGGVTGFPPAHTEQPGGSRRMMFHGLFVRTSPGDTLPGLVGLRLLIPVSPTDTWPEACEGGLLGLPGSPFLWVGCHGLVCPPHLQVPHSLAPSPLHTCSWLHGTSTHGQDLRSLCQRSLGDKELPLMKVGATTLSCRTVMGLRGARGQGHSLVPSPQGSAGRDWVDVGVLTPVISGAEERREELDLGLQCGAGPSPQPSPSPAVAQTREAMSFIVYTVGVL